MQRGPFYARRAVTMVVDGSSRRSGSSCSEPRTSTWRNSGQKAQTRRGRPQTESQSAEVLHRCRQLKDDKRKGFKDLPLDGIKALRTGSLRLCKFGLCIITVRSFRPRPAFTWTPERANSLHSSHAEGRSSYTARAGTSIRREAYAGWQAVAS